MTLRCFILWNGSAEVAAVEVPHETMLPPAGEGEEWREIDGPVVGFTLRLIDGKVTRAPRTLPASEALSLARSTRWNEARTYRDAYAAAGCMTPLGRVDTDDASVRKITGAVVIAVAAVAGGPPFDPIDWTMADNSIATHDAAAMMAMGVAVGRFVDACQQASVAVRAAIEASDEPTSVPIDEGYPA